MKSKKQIRTHFRNTVFQRDQHQCKACGLKTQPLDAHHITNRNEMPYSGYVPENGISLCPQCHLKAEEWHISQHLTFHPGYHPNDLYALIGSSYERALECCVREEGIK